VGEKIGVDDGNDRKDSEEPAPHLAALPAPSYTEADHGRAHPRRGDPAASSESNHP